MKQLKISSEKYSPTVSQGQQARGLLVGCFSDSLISMMGKCPEIPPSGIFHGNREGQGFWKTRLKWVEGGDEFLKKKQKTIVTPCLKLYLTFEISNNQVTKKNSNPSQIMDLK